MKIQHYLVLLGFAITTTAGAEGFRSDRLLLTWQDDPTTTMTVQWLETGEKLPLADGVGLAQPTPHAIPELEDTAFDASGDWWARGLALNFLADPDHDPYPSGKLAAKARLGWDARGLRVLIRVTDPVAWEDPELQNIWNGDSIEFFLSDGLGSDYRYQVILSPGRTADVALRHNFYRHPGGPETGAMTLEQKVAETDDGYVAEVLLPWSNLPEIQVDQGADIALQMYVNSRDGAEAELLRVGLHPLPSAHRATQVAYAFQLSDEASHAINTRAVVERGEGRRGRLRVFGGPEMAGERIEARSGKHSLSEGTFTARGHGAIAELVVPEPPEGRRWGRLEIIHRQDVVASVSSSPLLQHKAPEPGTIGYWRAESTEDEALQAVADLAALEHWPTMFRQRVHLTGLEPDSDYRFRAEGSAEVFGFRTMPAHLGRPVRFAVGGDTRHRQAWMERTNRAAMHYDPDFVVWGGDFAYANGDELNLPLWEEWFEANYNSLIGADNRLVPVVPAIGNHEVIKGYYSKHADFEPSDAWRQKIAPYFYQLFPFPSEGYGALDFGDYLSFVILDSAHTNPIEGKQSEWLREVLSQRADRPYVLPVYHVAGYPSQRNFEGSVQKAVREHWMPLFEQYGVRMAFENHDHTYKRTHPIRGGEASADGIVYVGDGAWGVGVREGANRDAWYIDQFAAERHAIIVTIDASGLHLLTVNEDGEVIDEYEDAR